MNSPSYSHIMKDGLWNSNQSLVALLGLCPLLAVSNTTINGLGLGLATTFVLILSNVTVSLIRNYVKPEVRVPVFVLVIASFVTAVDLAMNAYLHDLHKVLGIFIPLIVTNCIIIARAEAFASKHSPDKAFMDGLAMGLGATAALVVLGAMRELLGKGTLLDEAELMFGEGARWLTLTVFHDYHGFLLAILPPGAFLGLGLMIALKNVIDARNAQPDSVQVPAAHPQKG